MKNIFILKLTTFFLCLLSILSEAQVRIGNIQSPGNSSALLDLNSTDKGLLLPRVSLSSTKDVTTIPDPANGLMIYNLKASGTGNTAVKANNIYTWKVDTWESTVELADIRALKVPIDYVLFSKANQIFSTSELATLNVSTNILPVTWSASDIIINNPTDISLINSTDFEIKTPSYYQISGSFTFAISTSVAGDASYVIVTMQSSTDGGATWVDKSASAISYEKDFISQANTTTDFPKPQTIFLPNTVKQFAANELIRFVLSKPVTTAANYVDGTGIQSRLTTDNTKTLRITKLTE